MQEAIEISIDSPDGIVDCRLEPETADAIPLYSATILYPNVVDGFSRSEIYCHNMRPDPETGVYYFDDGEEGIHPKIKKLEAKLSAAIANQK